MLNIKSSKKNYKYVRNAVNFGTIVAVILILMITFDEVVHAAKQNPFYYSYMNVVINILPNSDMEIIETQEVVYNTGEYHFGFRWIPMDRVESIQDVKVWGDGIEFTNNWLVMDWVEKRKSRGGSPGGDNHAFTSWREGNAFWIYWWHPKTIRGSRTFKVKYSVIGGIGISEHYDQLYWKAIFKDHHVPVMMSKVTVNFPYEIAPKSLVLESYGIGADSRLVDHKTIEFTTGRIPPREELEILVRFPHELLALFVALFFGQL